MGSVICYHGKCGHRGMKYACQLVCNWVARWCQGVVGMVGMGTGGCQAGGTKLWVW